MDTPRKTLTLNVEQDTTLSDAEMQDAYNRVLFVDKDMNPVEVTDEGYIPEDDEDEED